MSTKTFSLFDHLSNGRNRAYTATNLIEKLIGVVASDVCSFRRNSQTAYLFVERVRIVADKINELIGNVNTQTDPLKWDDYDAYTGAIDPLEQ